MEGVNNQFYDDLGQKWLDAKDHPIALLRAENRLRNPWIASKLRPSSSFLDIGCGAGLLANDLSARGHGVVGVDLSENSLAIAKKSGSATYVVADAKVLPFADNSFDAAAAMDLLEHVDDPAKVIAEAARVIKPGGLFFFHTFNKTFFSYLLAVKGVEWCIANAPPNMHLYTFFITPKKLKEMCFDSGLLVKEIRGVAPKIASWPFWKMVITRSVPPDFTFCFCSSLRTGYCGIAQKAGFFTKNSS